MNRFAGISLLCILFGLCYANADDDFFEKNDFRKTGFEKKLYYSLERIDGLTQQQKDAINQALKEFRYQKERQVFQNVKKFQSDDIQKISRTLASEESDVAIKTKESLLIGIHRALTPKQREQFIKKFQGMID